MKTFSCGSLAFPRFQTKDLTSCAPRFTACLDSTLPLQGQHSGEGQAAAILLEARCPGREPGPGTGSSRAGAELPPVRRRPRPVRGSSGAGARRGKQRANPVPPIPYLRPRGRVESRGNHGPRARALPPERLLNCVSAPLALRLGGWNPREPPSQSAPRFLPAPANGGARSWGVHETSSPSLPPTPRTSLCVG